MPMTTSSRTVRPEIDLSALTDLYVYSLGHEVAAIKLSGHAADQCADPLGRLLLIDLTLMRLDDLGVYPGPAVAHTRLAQSELRRLFGPSRVLDPATVEPVLSTLDAPADLIAAVIRFDRQGLQMLGHLGPLLPTPAAQALASSLHEAKARWVRLYDEVLDNLGQRIRRWPAS